MATNDFAWLDPALHPQTPAPQTPAPQTPAPLTPVKMETANEDKVLPPDYSQVLDPVKLSELWAAYQNRDLNLLGAMNGVQSNFDGTTYWDRDNRNGYINHQIEDPQACYIARQKSMDNVHPNNKMYVDMADFEAEKQKAFDKLFAYNSTKFSKETIQGAYRQKAAKRGAANRRANNVKRHEAMVVGIVEEIAALRDYSGVLDEKYKSRFDRLAKEVLAAAKVKMTPEIDAKLSAGAAPGAQA